MAIYVTGDFHQGYDSSKLTTSNWPAQKELTKDDILIIAGDFGCLWASEPNKTEQYWLDWLDDKSFTTLFIDGNHENHHRLQALPIIQKWGGDVSQVSKSVYYLRRGQYYTIDGYTFWCMGGARSHDIQDGILDLNKPEDKQKYEEWKNDYHKMFRIKNVSWWEQEVPLEEERRIGENNLAAHDYKVDYIITHEAPASDVILASHGCYTPDEYSKWLDDIRCKTDYKYWFFGHYHTDDAFSRQDICFYQRVRQIG